MPAFDRTGPTGRGAMTGRGLGNCGDSGEKSNNTQSGRPGARPFGGGFRIGRGFRISGGRNIGGGRRSW